MASSEYIVRVRGLPFHARDQDILQFFSNVNIEEVHFAKNNEGRPSGSAYLQLATLKDQKEALKFHQEYMGDRYLEVYEAKYSELEWTLKKNSAAGNKREPTGDFNPQSDHIIKLRGMPFEAGVSEVAAFFEGLVSIAEEGVLICKDYSGRPSGEAFVELMSEEEVEAALGKHNESMGHRYIEVFMSDHDEAMRAKDKTESAGCSGRGFGRGGFGGGGPMRGGGMRGGRNFGSKPYDRGFRGDFGSFDGPMRPPLGQGYGRGAGNGGFGRGGGGGYMGGYGGESFGRGGAGVGGFGRGGGNMGGFGSGGGGFGSGCGGFGSGNGGFGRGGRGNMRGNRGGSMGGGGYGGGGGFKQSVVIKMRGLPFRATENDITEWFSSVADCEDVMIEYNRDNRPSGNAQVMFASEEEAERAMSKHKQNMQSRYIELFYEGPV